MFRVFHYIHEVYKERSFSRAAKNLYLAQPSLSLTIKKFESEIGAQLFDRSTSPIGLTEVGKVYIEGIERILAIQQDLDAYLDDYNDLKTGVIRIGAPHFFSSYLLPGLIARFLDLYPDIEVQLVEGDFLSLNEQVLAGEIDLIVESNDFDKALFHSYPLFEEQVLLAVPKGDPVNAGLEAYALQMDEIRSDRHREDHVPPVALDIFRDRRLLMLERGHDMHARALRLCRDSGFEPNVFMTLNQLMTVYNLCDQQLGMAFVTDTIVKLSEKGRNLTFYKPAGDGGSRHIHFAHKRNRYITHTMRAFLELMMAIGMKGVGGLDDRS